MKTAHPIFLHTYWFSGSKSAELEIFANRERFRTEYKLKRHLAITNTLWVDFLGGRKDHSFFDHCEVYADANGDRVLIVSPYTCRYDDIDPFPGWQRLEYPLYNEGAASFVRVIHGECLRRAHRNRCEVCRIGFTGNEA